MPNRSYPPKPPPPPPPAPWASKSEKRLRAFTEVTRVQIRTALDRVAPWYRSKKEMEHALNYAASCIISAYELDMQSLQPEPVIRVDVDGEAAVAAITKARRTLTKARRTLTKVRKKKAR